MNPPICGQMAQVASTPGDVTGASTRAGRRAGTTQRHQFSAPAACDRSCACLTTAATFSNGLCTLKTAPGGGHSALALFCGLHTGWLFVTLLA
jgi:hypothetical protein